MRGDAPGTGNARPRNWPDHQIWMRSQALSVAYYCSLECLSQALHALKSDEEPDLCSSTKSAHTDNRVDHECQASTKSLTPSW